MEIVNLPLIGAGVTGKVTVVLHASRAKEKCSTKHCTVIFAQIDTGKLVVGETIKIGNINHANQLIEDEVSFIELEGTPVKFATPGQDIGVCLKKSKTTTLKKINNMLAELPMN